MLNFSSRGFNFRSLTRNSRVKSIKYSSVLCTFYFQALKHPHIGPNHLLEICSRLPSLLEMDSSLTPTVPGILSLLGAGRQSLLRTTERVSRPRSIREYCARSHGAPLFEALNRKNCHNIANVLYGRQSSGPLVRRQAVPTTFYGKAGLLRQTLGHLSAVYCVLFDRSGKYIVTVSDFNVDSFI